MARDLTSDKITERQKARAQRVDQSYYKRAHPWRTRLALLSWVLPLAGVAILGIAPLFSSGSKLYLPGPVSTLHAIIGDHCKECHVQEEGQWGAVIDDKCISCHDGPLHHSNMIYEHGSTLESPDEPGRQVGTPRCASCHSEHKGQERLTEMADRHCVQCHADLKATPESTFAKKIKSFHDGHPDWAVLVKEEKDPTQLTNWNHKKHLELTWKEDQIKLRQAVDPGFKRAAGDAMTCLDCHAPDQHRAYMKPISYELHCKSCHPIQIPVSKDEGKGPELNAVINGLVLSHEKPLLIQNHVKGAISDYLLKAGGQPGETKMKNPQYKKPKPGRKETEPEYIVQKDPRTPGEWVRENTDQVIRPLFFPEGNSERGASCLYCHLTDGKDEKTNLPKIKDPGIPNIWLKHSTFNHGAHRVISCESCHSKSSLSTETAQVLIPSIASCVVCHDPKGGARSGCVECHHYHDRSQTKFDGHKSMNYFKGIREGLSYSSVPETKKSDAKKSDDKKSDDKEGNAP